MANREARARIAAETLAICRAGTYRAPSGRDVAIGDAVALAVHQTRTIAPGETRSLRARAEQAVAGRGALATTFEVRNETTFAAARRLVERFGPDRVAALNFASAKNPGGGFLSGSQAQEESLARASALFVCLEPQTAYYDANRAERSSLYTDHLIVSPGVSVFRDDADALLDEPWQLTIVTAPAPNAGAIAKNEPETLAEVEPTLARRIANVLAAAVAHDASAIVLGAWGCGVFKNDPATVARSFAEALRAPPFAGAFEHVAFAVLDRDGTTIEAFAHEFGDAT